LTNDSNFITIDDIPESISAYPAYINEIIKGESYDINTGNIVTSTYRYRTNKFITLGNFTAKLKWSVESN